MPSCFFFVKLYLSTSNKYNPCDFYFFSEGNKNSSQILNKDKEWIVNSSKILEKLMKDYDAAMAPFVPGKRSLEFCRRDSRHVRDRVE